MTFLFLTIRSFVDFYSAIVLTCAMISKSTALLLTPNLVILVFGMKIIKPPRLCKGDVIGICAPASAPSSPTALDKAITYIEQLGYRVHLAKNVFRKRGYLAGTDAQRAEDLHELFSNRYVKAIFAARGGFGTQRILPLLDYNLIRRHPKIIVGYSDITALQLGLFAKAGLISISGAMAVEMPETFNKQSEEMFWRLLTSRHPLGTIHAKTTTHPKHGIALNSRGRLLGGNLSLVAALTGTQYSLVQNNFILLLEELDERPYRIDRMLQQLKLAGILTRTTGIVLGSFSDCKPAPNKPSLTLSGVFRDAFQEYSYPVLSGFRYGHIKNSFTFPVGVKACLDTRTNSIEFLEGAVTS